MKKKAAVLIGMTALSLILCITPAAADTLPADVVPISENTSSQSTSSSSESTHPSGSSADSSASETGNPSASKVGLSKPITADAKVSEGYYYLYPQLSKTRVISIQSGSKKAGANAYLYKKSSSDSQLFYIKSVGDGTYTVRNKKSGLVLETKDGGVKDKTNVQQGTYTGAVSQRWYIFKKGNYYVFQSAASRKVLNISGGKDKSKANACILKYSASTAQKFTLKKQSGTRKYKVSTRLWDDSRDYDIMTNIIGAVESGGQVYGNRDYASYEPPYANTSNEVTITLGWAQFYGEEAQTLIRNIYNKSPSKFKKIDKKGRIQKALKKNWVSTRWKPNSKEKKVLIKLITSDIGKKCQDDLFKAQMTEFVAECKRLYTNNAWGVHMYCQIRHLGGFSGVKRIFDRCGGDYSLDSIMNALRKDQSDGSSSNQVGDSLFWSRHQKCCEFLQKYAV